MNAFRKLCTFWRKNRFEADMAEELRLHLEQRTREYIAEGMAPDEARFTAQRQFGNVTRVKEVAREQQSWSWLENLARDVRYSVRQLRRSPGFATVAVLTLGLGIGVNTAIFTLVDAVSFAPLPFPHPEQVMQFYTRDKKDPEKFRAFSYPIYRELREQSGQFTGIMAHRQAVVGVGEGANARRTLVEIVSANYFDVLGVKLFRGRSFSVAEEAPGDASSVVIASYLFWKKRGFDPSLVGSSIRLNERLYTVVGIAPENFSGTTVLFGPELYVPVGQFDQLSDESQGVVKHTLEQRDAFEFFLVGRLRPEIASASAQAALGAFATNLERADPVLQKDQTFFLGPLPRDSTSTSPPSRQNRLVMVGLLLLGMAGIVLIVASLNLANLLLARSAARRKEFAIRLAVGGGRGRLVKQLLTEGMVLSLTGGFVGLVLAIWSTKLLMGSLALIIPESIFFSGSVSPTILGATFGFSVLSTLVFALGPALKFSRGDVMTDLKEQSGDDSVPRHGWLPRSPLVVVQIAFSLGLLTCAGLFLRGALKAADADIGLNANDTLIMEVDASLAGYNETRALQLYNQIGENLAALPGVQSASVASFVPFGFSSDGSPVRRAGLSLASDAKPATAAEGLSFDARWNSVGADYFSTLGLPLLRGRPFTPVEADVKGGPAVAIIDDVLAKKLWPDGDALHQRVQYGYDGPGANTIEVVGIVPAVRTSLFREMSGAIYVPFAQGFRGAVNFHLRTKNNTHSSALALFDQVRRELRAVAPGVSMFKLRTFRQHLDASGDLWAIRMGAIIFSLFGGLALVLAVVGLYGVKAYSVARRTREIGIRIALGADPLKVLAMILRESLAIILSGALLGLLLAWGLGHLCASLLYQVSPVDPISFILAPVILIGTAMVACFLPASRAARVDPLVALRTE